MLKVLVPPSIKECKIDRLTKICGRTELLCSEIGRYSYVGYHSTVLHTKIGQFCSIGNGVSIGAASHTIKWVSTSPVFNRARNILRKNFSNCEYDPFDTSIIENDVWIGEGAKIRSGVRICNGAVIAAGAVVTHDVGPYEIWAGVPARMIKKRFCDEAIKKLLAIEWWNWDEDKLVKFGDDFCDIELFVKKHFDDLMTTK